MAVTPLTQLGSRFAEQGRIRYGVKTERAMKAIGTWRFTSPDEQAIRTLADTYGGTARPWSDPKARQKNQFEVITDAAEIEIWLPPDALSINYEMWTGGGCARRCDGITCEQTQQTGPDQYDPVGVPCLCAAQGEMACKPYTRLSVVLPGVRFGGVWRMETKGWNAAHEMPAMVDMIYGLQTQDLTVGRLKLEQREQIKEGKKKQFVVPVLVVDRTPQEIVSGQASALSLERAHEAPVAALAEYTPGDGAEQAGPVEAEVLDADLERLLSACLDLDQAPDLDAWGLAERWGSDAERKARGLLDGSAKWTSNGRVVRA